MFIEKLLKPVNTFWNALKIRWKLLFIILPTAIIPLVIVITFSTIRIYNHLENQGRTFYFTLLTQVKKNIDLLYQQYGRTLTNMMTISSVRAGLNAPPYRTKQEELNIKQMVMGDETTEGGFRNTAEEKIDGNVYLYEMDRKSLATETNYTVHILNAKIGELNYDKLINDPLFLLLKNNNKIKMIFGIFQKGVAQNQENEDKPVIILPYYQKPPEKDTDTFTKFVVVLLNKDFIPVFYQDIEALQFGTLYIMDRNNNIISYNHPGDQDFYDYDTTKKTYTLGNNLPIEEGELLTFSDYQMLNSDMDILKTKDVTKLLDLLTNEGVEDMLYSQDTTVNIFEKKNYITYKGRQYLTIVQFGEQSETKYVYFHPIKQIQKPLFEITNIIIIMTFFIIILIIFISFLFSRTFTNPIRILVEATKIITSGDYNHFTIVSSTDEIGDLSQNFNQMLKNIKLYQDKLLSAEREKSELELASRIQTCLLPSIPEKEFYDITATMIPAAEVGGDYYDLIGETDGRIWFGIGDVSGHGLTSGLIMMMAQSAFNTILLSDPDIPSDKLISQVNKVMYQNIKERLGEDHFMTLSFMIANPDGTVRFSGAHLDVLIYRQKTKQVERIETFGIWLGLLPDIKESTIEKKFKLESGDLMFLYTDGLIEATNFKGEQYDMKRLITKLSELGEKPIKEIEEQIIADVFKFLHEQKDDISFVIARKK